MSDASTTENKTVPTARIIIIAMVLGATFFAAIAAFILFGGAGKQEAEPKVEHVANQNFQQILPFVGLIGAVFAIVAKQFVSSLLVRKETERLQRLGVDQEQAWEVMFRQLFLMKTIISGALLEGAFFFNMVLIIVSEEMWPWGTVGVLYLMLIMQIPSQLKAESWVRDNLRKVRDEGLMSDLKG